MIIETLISRGGSPVRYRIGGFEYVFRRNDDGDFVCPVLSGEHIKLLCGTGNFRLYNPKRPGPEKIDVPMIATRPDDLPKDTEPEESNAPESVTEPALVRKRGGRRSK